MFKTQKSTETSLVNRPHPHRVCVTNNSVNSNMRVADAGKKRKKKRWIRTPSLGPVHANEKLGRKHGASRDHET